MEAHQDGFFYARMPRMKFTKRALTLDEQLALLQRRGMTVRHLAAARHHLLHHHYYRLRAYWLPDEIPAAVAGDHAFRRGTTFEAVVDRYAFDRKLRLLVMDAIEKFEVSLRSRWAYVLSIRHGTHAYLNPGLFRKTGEHQKCLARIENEMQRSPETFVAHYRNTYTEPAMPPVWAACELMSLGQLSLWFRNLAGSADRAEIAAPYGLDEQLIQSLAHHLTYVRNVCAHHSRLWNRELTIAFKLPDHPQWLKEAFNAERPKRVYNTLVMLAYVLDCIDPGHLWKSAIHALLKDHPKIDLLAMGFKPDWSEFALWGGR